MAIDQKTQSVDVSRHRRELLPNIIDHLGHIHTGGLYAEYAVSPMTYDEGYCHFTYGNLFNAINRVTWFLNETLGQGINGEGLTCIGLDDLQYIALVIGLVKAGYVVTSNHRTERQRTLICQMFFTSPRNSVAAQAKLLGH